MLSELLTTAYFPNSPSWDGNPYYPLLHQSLRRHGVQIENPHNDFVSSQWLIGARKRVQLLHFHWLQYHYKTLAGTGSTGKLLTFVRKLWTAKMFGYRIVWTMHNVMPHESLGRVDLWARRVMVRLADAVLVLCGAGQRALGRRFGRTKNVHITPHGHFLDAYRPAPPTIPTDTIRFLFPGTIRPYKGVFHLIESFKQLDSRKIELTIAGATVYPEDRSRLASMVADDARIHLHLDRISDDDLPELMAATDVVVLPFRRILSSSSVIMAMGFGKPLIVPDLGCLPEWVSAENALLYDPNDVKGLRTALREIQSRDLRQMGARNRSQVAAFDWDTVATRTIAAYRSCL